MKISTSSINGFESKNDISMHSKSRKILGIQFMNILYIIRYISVKNENMERYYRTRILLMIKNGFGRNLWIAKQKNLTRVISPLVSSGSEARKKIHGGSLT